MGLKKTKNKETELSDSIEEEYPLSEEAKDNPTIPKKKSVVWIAFKSVKTKLSLTDEGATPVNWKCIFLVFVSLFSSSFSITFLFPFLPDMILSFGYEEVEKGYYAGLVASAMFVGRTFGCYFWGWISDKKGRRPIVLTSVLLVGIFSLVFGFATNIYFVIIVRMLSGLVNGTVGTAKTILYEISDDTNQAVGMSIISISWGLGIVAGPAIGGYLANPCKQYPSIFPSEGLFYEFPYFLPAFFGFVISVVAFIIDLIWLPETLHTKQESESNVEDEIVEDDEKLSLHSTVANGGSPTFKRYPVHLREINPRMAASCEDLHLESEGATYLASHGKEIHITRRGISFTDVQEDDEPQSSHKQSKHDFYIDNDTTVAVADSDDNAVTNKVIRENEKDVDIHEVNKSDEVFVEDGGCCNRVKQWSFVRLIRQPDVLLANLLYSFFSFGVIGVEDIFSVWASTDIMLDGLGFQPRQIGAVLGTTSLPMMFLQLFLFPNLVRRLGIKKTLVVCTVILYILTQAMPVLHILINRPVTMWILLLSSNVVMKVMISCVFSATGLIINNSVEPKLAGQVNGLAMTITAISRSIAPVFGGFIFSWTVGYSSENIGAPFDVSFVFFLFGLVYWLVALLGVTIPERLNRQKK